MYPDRERESYLDQSGERYDDQTQEQNDENGRAVSRVLSGEIKTADLARAAHLQEAGKQSSLAASWAPAAERGADRGDCRKPHSSRDAGAAAALAPPIDANKEEQPHDVDEMPIPRGRLEPE